MNFQIPSLVILAIVTSMGTTCDNVQYILHDEKKNVETVDATMPILFKSKKHFEQDAFEQSNREKMLM